MQQISTTMQDLPESWYAPTKNKKKKDSFGSPFDSSADKAIKTEDNQPGKALCLSHNVDLTHICFSCNYCTLCPECFGCGNHRGHKLKTLQRSQQLVCHSLNECLIRLDSKSQILQILHDQLGQNCSDSFKESRSYSESIQLQFEAIISLVANKLKDLQEQITRVQERHAEQIQRTRNSIRNYRMDYEKARKTILEMIETGNVAQLCQFYSEKKEMITKLIAQDEIVAFKEKLHDIKWSIDVRKVDDAMQLISGIVLLHEDIEYLRKKDCAEQKKSKKKLGSKAIGKTWESDKQFNQVYIQATMTPKDNKSRERLYRDKKTSQVNLLRHYQQSNGKITSMPSSPVKDIDSSYTVSTKKRLFKKKIQK